MSFALCGLCLCLMRAALGCRLALSGVRLGAGNVGDGKKVVGDVPSAGLAHIHDGFGLAGLAHNADATELGAAADFAVVDNGLAGSDVAAGGDDARARLRLAGDAGHPKLMFAGLSCCAAHCVDLRGVLTYVLQNTIELNLEFVNTFVRRIFEIGKIRAEWDRPGDVLGELKAQRAFGDSESFGSGAVRQAAIRMRVSSTQHIPRTASRRLSAGFPSRLFVQSL